MLIGHSGWHRFRSSCYFVSSTKANWRNAKVCIFFFDILKDLLLTPYHLCDVWLHSNLLEVFVNQFLRWLFTRTVGCEASIQVPCKRKGKWSGSVEWFTPPYLEKNTHIHNQKYCVTHPKRTDQGRSLAEINRIYHHIAERTRDSHARVHDLQSTTRRDLKLVRTPLNNLLRGF